MTHVKICSVQEVEHALAAAETGADFVGFNFAPGVRRRLPEERARIMVQTYREKRSRNGPKLVGIFVDQPLEQVNRILGECDLDMAQLSGHEPLDYCSLVDRPVIKAVRVPIGQPAEEVVNTLDAILAELEEMDILPLLDPEVAKGAGGTGMSFDWDIARELALRHRFLMAGGLSPENVDQAVRDVRPWGVDVSSGVETDGIKDVEKIMAFVQKAKGAGVSM